MTSIALLREPFTALNIRAPTVGPIRYPKPAHPILVTKEVGFRQDSRELRQKANDYSRCTSVNEHGLDSKDRLTRIHIQVTKVHRSSKESSYGGWDRGDGRDQSTLMSQVEVFRPCKSLLR
jgi:hypothetical protein